MNIAQIEGLTTRHIAALQAADWTVATLATATAADLTVIKGIGAKTASVVIAGARDMVNAHKLYVSRRLQFGDSGPFIPPADMPAMSARVKRIQERLNVTT